ncbi:MAG: thioredoxin-disulfide reductase [bacterium]|nr:thioredoxin-disulfide reductase [bacterium]
METKKRDVIIIGSGPAGLTAAIYAARANLKPLLFEGFQPGGQLMITTEVDNFPGFKNGIMGPELMEELRAQAERFGTEFITSDVTKVELTADKKRVWEEDDVYEASTVIISTGASANLMGLENESRLMGHGVSACATCDGFFFKDKEICVVGGGDSAMEEATYLTRFASKVYIIHRREEFRASKIMVQKAKDNEKIEFILNSVVDDVLGDQKVTGVRLRNTVNNEVSDFNLDGVFVAIGHTPNTQLFKGQLEIDSKGYLTTSTDKSNITATSVPGVYACGDVQDSHYKQAITAAGTGCAAALDAEQFIEAQGHK